MRRLVVRRVAIGRIAVILIGFVLLILAFTFIRLGFKYHDARTSFIDRSSYSGRWYGEDHYFDPYRGIKYEVGTALQLVLTKEDNRVVIIFKSPPPINYIAHIGAKLKPGPDHTATFRFDDDDWGNAGHGTIFFGQDQIRISIKLNKRPTSKFWMFQGVKRLSKTEPLE